MLKTIFIALYLMMIPIFTYANDNRWEWFYQNPFHLNSFFDKKSIQYNPQKRKAVVWVKSEALDEPGTFIISKYLLDYEIKSYIRLEEGSQVNQQTSHLKKANKVLIPNGISPEGYEKDLADRVSSYLKIPKVYGDKPIQWNYIGQFNGKLYYITPDANVYFKDINYFRAFFKTKDVLESSDKSAMKQVVDQILSIRGFGCEFNKHKIIIGRGPEEIIPESREGAIYNAAFKMFKDKKFYITSEGKKRLVLYDTNGNAAKHDLKKEKKKKVFQKSNRRLNNYKNE